jgi:high-affinity iron transporter
MLSTTVIIILREVLEASLLISILAAVSGTTGISRRWIGLGLALGLAGAVTFSFGIVAVSEWLDGFGQEIVSAGMQMTMYLCLLAIVALVLRYSSKPGGQQPWIRGLMAATVALAVTREGFEVLVYVYGFLGAPSQLLTVLMGAVIGTGIGISTGVLLYYLLRSAAVRNRPAVGFCLLGLVGSGLLLQATTLLMQADWLPGHAPLWDTSSWVAENSVTGQLLYVLIGYEATPTAIQVLVYLAGLLSLIAMALWVGRSAASPEAGGGET